MQKLLNTSKLYRFLASSHFTCINLGALFLLTVWGTFFQIEKGLFAAKQLIFQSWFYTWMGYIPIPGAKLILVSCTINILAVVILKTHWSFKKSGLIIVHLGLVMLIAGAGLTFFLSQESSIAIYEGESTHTSIDYEKWELFIRTFPTDNPTKLTGQIIMDLSDLSIHKTIQLSQLGLSLGVISNYANCQPFYGDIENVTNNNHIARLEALPKQVEMNKNTPGIELAIQLPSSAPKHILIYGVQDKPTAIVQSKKMVQLSLRRKQYSLPFSMQLIDFKKEEHLGTSMPSHFESRLWLQHHGISREAMITMNSPLRIENYTVYQHSYHQTERGEQSVFAIVWNPVREIPYLSSLMISFGLILHYAIFFLQKRNR